MTLPSADNEIKDSLNKYGVNRDIATLLTSLFPAGSFKRHLPLFIEAIEKPANLKDAITRFEIELGLGITSHIAIVARELLSLSNFSMFTRDYIKRCGDLVEYFVKTRLLCELPACKPNRSLGSIIYTLKSKYSAQVPKELLDALKSFDILVYRPAKHTFDSSGKPLFALPDAVAVTFISIRLCQQVDQHGKHLRSAV